MRHRYEVRVKIGWKVWAVIATAWLLIAILYTKGGW